MSKTRTFHSTSFAASGVSTQARKLKRKDLAQKQRLRQQKRKWATT
jgi:hypothetical protein